MDLIEFKDKCKQLIKQIEECCRKLPNTKCTILEQDDIRCTVQIASMIPEIGIQTWCVWRDKEGKVNYGQLS